MSDMNGMDASSEEQTQQQVTTQSSSSQAVKTAPTSAMEPTIESTVRKDSSTIEIPNPPAPEPAQVAEENAQEKGKDQEHQEENRLEPMFGASEISNSEEKERAEVQAVEARPHSDGDAGGDVVIKQEESESLPSNTPQTQNQPQFETQEEKKSSTDLKQPSSSSRSVRSSSPMSTLLREFDHLKEEQTRMKDQLSSQKRRIEWLEKNAQTKFSGKPQSGNNDKANGRNRNNKREGEDSRDRHREYSNDYSSTSQVNGVGLRDRQYSSTSYDTPSSSARLRDDSLGYQHPTLQPIASGYGRHTSLSSSSSYPQPLTDYGTAPSHSPAPPPTAAWVDPRFKSRYSEDPYSTHSIDPRLDSRIDSRLPDPRTEPRVYARGIDSPPRFVRDISSPVHLQDSRVHAHQSAPIDYQVEDPYSSNTRGRSPSYSSHRANGTDSLADRIGPAPKRLKHEEDRHRGKKGDGLLGKDKTGRLVCYGFNGQGCNRKEKKCEKSHSCLCCGEKNHGVSDCELAKAARIRSGNDQISLSRKDKADYVCCAFNVLEHGCDGCQRNHCCLSCLSMGHPAYLCPYVVK